MDIGEVIGGGFRTIRDRPLAVAVWALIYLLLFVPAMLLMRPFMDAQMRPVGGDPRAQIAAMGALVGPFLLYFALMLIVYVILFAAAQRAVLKPEQHRFFYLRLGMDELRLLALTILFTLIFYVAIFALMFALIALTVAVIRLGSIGLNVLMAFIDFLAAVAFTAWYYMRFGLAFPLTLMRGKIIIGEAWRISRGRFWALFGASLVILVILFVCWVVVSTLTNGAYFAEIAQNAGNPVAIQRAEQAQVARQFSFSGMAIVTWVLGGILGALTVTLWGGAAATAVQQLTFDREKIAETFA